MSTKQVEKVITKENYLSQMWNDIENMFSTEKHSYIVLRHFDMYDDDVFNRIEKGISLWRDIKLEVYKNIDFTELLRCIGDNLLNIGICNQLPHIEQKPTYIRATFKLNAFEVCSYYIYQITNSSEFKTLVDNRYLLSDNNQTQKEYGNNLAKEFGKIVEPIQITK